MGDKVNGWTYTMSEITFDTIYKYGGRRLRMALDCCEVEIEKDEYYPWRTGRAIPRVAHHKTVLRDYLRQVQKDERDQLYMKWSLTTMKVDTSEAIADTPIRNLIENAESNAIEIKRTSDSPLAKMKWNVRRDYPEIIDQLRAHRDKLEPNYTKRYRDEYTN